MDGDDESWKTEPPYRRPEDAKSEDGGPFKKLLEASCHCQRVKYWISRDTPLASKFCHCADCKNLHGAPFQWAAIFHKTDLAFEHGTEHLTFYNAAEQATHHELPCKVKCSFCGSLIMDEGRNMVLLFPTLIQFKEKDAIKKFEVQCHMFYPQRVVDIPDGKVKWTGLDEKSEKMDLP